VSAGDTHLTPITAKERRKLDERIRFFDADVLGGKTL
jgi:hypothetical protein